MRHAPRHLAAPEGRASWPRGGVAVLAGTAGVTEGLWGLRVKPSLSAGSPAFSASTCRACERRAPLSPPPRPRYRGVHRAQPHPWQRRLGRPRPAGPTPAVHSAQRPRARAPATVSRLRGLHHHPVVRDVEKVGVEYERVSQEGEPQSEPATRQASSAEGSVVVAGVHPVETHNTLRCLKSAPPPGVGRRRCAWAVLALSDQGSRAPRRDPRVRAPVPGARRGNAGPDCSGAGTRHVLAAGPQRWELRLTSMQNWGSMEPSGRRRGMPVAGGANPGTGRGFALCCRHVEDVPGLAGGGRRCCGTPQGSDGDAPVSSVRAQWTPPWPLTLGALLRPCPFLTLPAFYGLILQLERVTTVSPAF